MANMENTVLNSKISPYVVVIPDSFKGSLSSIEVCDIVECGIKSVLPEAVVKKIPVADGGEGTVDAYIKAVGGEYRELTVTAPLFDKVCAKYGLIENGSTAIIEMAAASGLMLVEGREAPLKTTTYGTGEMIADALKQGVNRIIIGIGGSATNDGGAGMACALGVKFFDRDGKAFIPTGGTLDDICGIDVSEIDPLLKETEIIAACDVPNTLCGKNGASYIFAPQKGATPSDVELLDKGLRHYAEIINNALGVDVLNLAGGGAAGGLGAGLHVFCKASLRGGADLLLETARFAEIANKADLIITGEGCFDSQTLFGKLPSRVAQFANGKKIAIIAGKVALDEEEVKNAGFVGAFASTNGEKSFEEIKMSCRSDLLVAAKRLITQVYLSQAEN